MSLGDDHPSKSPTAGLWDYDGKCRPRSGDKDLGHGLFSVGIFQWVPKRSGSGVKRTPVVQRVVGLCRFPEDLYVQANTILEKLNGAATPHQSAPDNARGRKETA